MGYMLIFLCVYWNCEICAHSVDVAQGYMTNSDLEKAIKAFGQRCSNISRVYRWLLVVFASFLNMYWIKL